MTPASFNKRMADLMRTRNTAEARRDGVALIRGEFGENAGAYLPGIFALFERMQPSPSDAAPGWTVHAGDLAPQPPKRKPSRARAAARAAARRGK